MIGFVIILIGAVFGQQSDRVQSLIGDYQHPWYSGFLNVTSDKALHYVFFESQHDHQNDPLVVWLGNKLGCSSMLSMVHENGPFVFRHNATRYDLNNHSWNKAASVLYIETLGSVGFSLGPVNNSDESSAKDNLRALQVFFSKYPLYRKNDLYLSGSGYAGTTAPFLALEIHNHNLEPSVGIRINLKGLLLGNPCTHPRECYQPGVDGRSIYEVQFLYKHAFIDEALYERFRAACLLAWQSTSCYNVKSKIDLDFRASNSSLDNIYGRCYHQKDHYDDNQCQDTMGAEDLFNQPLNQVLLHVFGQTPDWKPCNHEVGYKFKSNENGSYLLHSVLSKFYRIWLYSGDVSAEVPVTGTIHWMQQLREEVHIPVMEPWREWWLLGKHTHQDQVGGMVWKLRNITLVTLKGAGFRTANSNPQGMQMVLNSFLSGKHLPRKDEL